MHFVQTVGDHNTNTVLLKAITSIKNLPSDMVDDEVRRALSMCHNNVANNYREISNVEKAEVSCILR